MSFINMLGLEDPGYGNVAKGILYAIYELFFKVVYACNSLLDLITGLFYKLAGANYLGSGSETLVEEQDLFTRIFNQNIVSNLSIAMTLIAVTLMTIFGAISVIKQNYLSKEEAKSTSYVIKNMVLATVLLIALTPVTLFLISSISTITISIVSLFGDTSSTSLADLMFNISFNGDAIGAYNAIYGTSITSWNEMNNGFLFDLNYGTVSTGVTFYWYIYILGMGVVLYNLIIVVVKLVKRIFMLLIMYLLAPIYISKMVDDGGNKFREWKNKVLPELISIIGTVVAFMLLISLVGIISDFNIISIGGESGLAEEDVTLTVVLINNLTKMVLIMAGTIVTKDSGELLGNVFKGANDDSGALLEGIFNRLGPKEYAVSTKGNGNSAPRTRVITKNTTTTRKIIDYSESIPVRDTSSYSSNKGVNINNNNRINVSNNITNLDRKQTNLQNRTQFVINEGSKVSDRGLKVGNYRPIGENGNNTKPTDILKEGFTNSFMNETNKLRNEFEAVKGSNSKSSSEIVKNFESASKEFDSALKSGEPTKIKNSMNKYVEAYKSEEKSAKESYKDFAGKSSKLTNDLTNKQQMELKKISNAYRKAQVDYSKTARKLGEVSAGNMTAVDALRVKEKADKQREKLMEASSRANSFYNNQKKGV